MYIIMSWVRFTESNDNAHFEISDSNDEKLNDAFDLTKVEVEPA